MLKDMLEDYCENISFLLSRASIDEALIDKPGNASRVKDIKSVSFSDLIYSALVMKDFYKEACKMRREKEYFSLYKLLYEAVIESKRLNFNFSIFGTAMQLLPIAYSSLFSLKDTLSKTSQVIKALNKNDSYYFSLTLKELKLSYLGKISNMDYTELKKYDLYSVLLKSAEIDSSVRNMIFDYKYSLEVVEEIKSKGIEEGVVYSFIKILCEIPDGLIFRKYGGFVAIAVSKYACEILHNYSLDLVKKFDEFLTKNNFNPGSTADIIATGIALYYLDEWYKKNSLNYTGTLQRGCDRIS
ncbi:triphosphoribosyl-dephospho-CoA synthase [Sulfurisphaera javensis]|uniref:Triphosphoribosyl-dephospho-CoA synthase n=1 Tax=Sulfurisphaera javensis TaxID=2049879 RepID=A0AAT9GQV5_9CREN